MLVDDLNYFPAYMAAPLAFRLRKESASGADDHCLAGLLDAQSMRRLNAEVAVKGKSYAEVASEFLSAHSYTQYWIVEVAAVARDLSETLGHGLRHL